MTIKGHRSIESTEVFSWFRNVLFDCRVNTSHVYIYNDSNIIRKCLNERVRRCQTAVK